jgi:serine/threonine protein kinase
MEIMEGNDCKCGYKPENNPFALQPGTILNERYLIGRVLGHGGFGITYLGFDLNLESKVAIKEYVPEGIASRVPGVNSVRSISLEKDTKYQDGIQKFLEEARTVVKFKTQQNIVPVKDFFKENGTAYLVMDFIEGNSLQNHLQSCGGKIAWNEMLDVVRQLVGALSQIHEKNYLHRDIAPDNIYITDSKQVWLLDFGAARHHELDSDKTMTAVVKAGFAPMEQYSKSGKQGPWSDIYALAATIYYCITGVMPPNAFDRLDQDTLKRPADEGAMIPPQAENALMKALSLRPEQRFSTIQEFWGQLNVRLDVEPNIQKQSEMLQRGSNPSTRPTASAKPTGISPSSPKTAFLDEQQGMTGQLPQGYPPSQQSSSMNPTMNTSTPNRKKKNRMPMLAGIAAVAITGLVLFLIFNGRMRKNTQNEPASVTGAAMNQTGPENNASREPSGPPIEAEGKTPPNGSTNQGRPPEQSEPPEQGGPPNRPPQPGSPENPGNPPFNPEADPGKDELENPLIQPAQPPESSLPAKLTQPPEPNTPVKPTQPPEPNTPAKPTQPPEPDTPVKPTRPPEHNTPVKPTQPPESNTPAKPTQPAASGQNGGSQVMTYTNGDVYEGQMADGKKAGSGTYYYTDGTYYTGNWKDDYPDGYGECYFSTGDVYKGQWTNGSMNGEGYFYSYSYNTEYIGAFTGGAMSGYGVLTYPDGSFYEGNFLNGFFNGNGTYYAPEYTFIGQWSNGMPISGTYYDIYGNVIENGISY